METILKKLNSPFPFYLNDERKNIIFTVAVGVFVFIFLLLFQISPYQFHQELTTLQKLLFGGITYAVLFFNIIVLPKIFSQTFDPTSWTVGKYILHTLLNIFIIGMAGTVIDELYICPEKSLWENFVGANIQVAIVGIVPVSLISLFLRNLSLQENLKSAIEANRELEKIKNLKKDLPKSTSNSAFTLYSETSETLTLHLPDLLFIQADDNYSTIFWKNGHGIQKKLLRINLKHIETQINNAYAIRCHRSYIVNVTAISNISGNTNGYKLQILDTDYFIPVSRPKGKDVIQKIQQLRNMMELA